MFTSWTLVFPSVISIIGRSDDDDDDDDDIDFRLFGPPEGY